MVRQKFVIFIGFAVMAVGWWTPAFGQQHCRLLKQRIASEQGQLVNTNRKIQFVDNALNTLERRRRTLETKKGRLLNKRSGVQNRLIHDRSIFKQSCGNCNKLKVRVDNLTNTLNRILDKLEAVAVNIRQVSREVNNLNGRVSSIKVE